MLNIFHLDWPWSNNGPLSESKLSLRTKARAVAASDNAASIGRECLVVMARLAAPVSMGSEVELELLTELILTVRAGLELGLDILFLRRGRGGPTKAYACT